MTRLQRFRAYMARMNPVADPALAIQEGLYVAPPGRSVAKDLATRLELEPASTHLVLGGIGSGKTSELLRAVERLNASLPEAGDHVEYVDVSRDHDLGVPRRLTGVLVSLAGLALIRQVSQRIKKKPKSQLAAAIEDLQSYARGKSERQDYPPEEDEEWESDGAEGYWVDTPGVLVAPETPIPAALNKKITHLRAVRRAYPGPDKHVVFFFDSLDRLPAPALFLDAVQHDLRVLKAAGIGVVVVGPIRFLAGADRSMSDLFDHTHFQLATDPSQPAGLTFLTSVLRARAEQDLLSDECVHSIARASGGVMRDLIALAKRAGEEAYAAGNDSITREDANRAIDAFGRSLAIGLDDEQLKKLRHLRSGGGFVIRGERDLTLLETRRVLLYDQSRWIVHPALAPLLDAMPEAA